MEDLINRIRFFHYISGVLVKRQSDPLCGYCRAFANTVRWTGEGISNIESGEVLKEGAIPGGIIELLWEAKRMTSGISVPENTVGQKKEGNCRMPAGVCFVKISKSVLERI